MGKWLKIKLINGEISFIRTEEIRGIGEDSDAFVISLKSDGHAIYASHINIAGEDDIYEWIVKKNKSIFDELGEE